MWYKYCLHPLFLSFHLIRQERAISAPCSYSTHDWEPGKCKILKEQNCPMPFQPTNNKGSNRSTEVQNQKRNHCSLWRQMCTLAEEWRQVNKAQPIRATPHTSANSSMCPYALLLALFFVISLLTHVPLLLQETHIQLPQLFPSFLCEQTFPHVSLSFLSYPKKWDEKYVSSILSSRLKEKLI